MKQYHWVRLYQVSSSKGYLKNNEIYRAFYFLPTLRDVIVPEAEYSVESKKIILVEKLSQYQVREVKTGIVFPIVEFKKNQQEDLEYVSTNLKKVHTFVCGKSNELISSKVATPEELEIYDQSHLDVKKYKEELLSIIEVGKSNMENKIEQEKYNRKQKIRDLIMLFSNKRAALLTRINDSQKVRKLQNKFRQ